MKKTSFKRKTIFIISFLFFILGGYGVFAQAADFQYASLPFPSPYCGDGIKNQVSEECDGTDGVTSGYTCTSGCLLESSPYCGDGACNGDETCSTCSQDCGQCGGGGGGGGGIPSLTIHTIKTECSLDDTITITWHTNLDAKGRVVYDTVSPPIGNSPNYGYSYSTEEETEDKNFHSFTISGIQPGEMYYLRPISTRGSTTVYGDQVSQVGCQVAGAAFILEIEKTASSPFANPDSVVEYTIIVSNTGTANAENLKVTDTLPEGLVFNDTKTATRSWLIDLIEAGAETSFIYEVYILPDTTVGFYENFAALTQDDLLIDEANYLLDVREVVILGEEFTELPDTGSGVGIYYSIFTTLFIATIAIYFIKTKRDLAARYDIKGVNFINRNG